MIGGMRLKLGVIALVAAVAAGLPTGPARAAACNQVTDKAGDAQDVAGANGSLDILSADLGSDNTSLTAVIRLKKLTDSSPTTPQARNYYVLFSTRNPAARMFLTVTLYQAGVARYAWGTVGPVDPLGALTLYDDGSGVLHRATGFVDLVKNELHVTALVSDLAAKGGVKPGTQIDKLEAATFYQLGGFIFESDKALGKGSYIAGSPSCVTPGK